MIDHAIPDKTFPTDFNTTVSYVCEPGYEFTDGSREAKNATCMTTGDWELNGINCTGTYSATGSEHLQLLLNT